MFKMQFCLLAVILVVVTAEISENPPRSARIESCSSCSLNRLPEVKKFIFEDVPKYANVEFKSIHGAKPELVILDADESEIERLPLSQLNREECNELLKSKGFKLKIEAKEL